MTKLSVNVNKIATIRNARGGNLPNVVKFAIDCERFGADGITVHPRPDQRHITIKDVEELAAVVSTEFNIEGYPDQRYLEMIERYLPAQATLVPDPPNVLTSNEGWSTKANFDFLKDLADQLRGLNVRSSIFVDTQFENIEYAAKSGVDRIELYTGPYAEDPEGTILEYVQAAQYAKECGLEINAGHDLSLDNLKKFNQAIPFLSEVSIGHALISDCLYFGLENTVQLYKRELV